MKAKRRTKSIMNTMAVHFHEHLEERSFLKWNREAPWGKCVARRLLRTGNTGTGAPNAGWDLSFLSILSKVLLSCFPGLLQDEFDL